MKTIELELTLNEALCLRDHLMSLDCIKDHEVYDILNEFQGNKLTLDDAEANAIRICNEISEIRHLMESVTKAIDKYDENDRTD